MKTKKIWVLAAILICGTMVLTSCKSNDDNAVPDTSALELWQAGKTVTAEAVAAFGGIDKCFAAEPIPDGVWARMQGKTFKENPYIGRDDLCFKLFTEAGFEWGGDWTTRKDYQHFEIVE